MYIFAFLPYLCAPDIREYEENNILIGGTFIAAFVL